MRNLDADQLATLKDYAAGRLGTRATVERLGLHDYADLVIELSQRDLPFPKPRRSKARDQNLVLVSALLQPRLRRGD